LERGCIDGRFEKIEKELFSFSRLNMFGAFVKGLVGNEGFS
jgi:hypothetical protein